MRIPALAAAFAALLSLVVPAYAQDTAPPPPPADTAVAAADTTPRTSLQKGTWSLSFAPPGFATSGDRAEFGAWKMVGNRTNLGVTLMISVIGVDSESSISGGTTIAATTVDLGVNVKRYVMAPRDVTPFLLAGAFIGGRYERRDGPDEFEETTRGMAGTVLGAVGVEWFPVRRLSLSGQTGFLLRSGRYRTEATLPDETKHESESSSVVFGSFTSALSLQIYF